MKKIVAVVVLLVIVLNALVIVPNRSTEKKDAEIAAKRPTELKELNPVLFPCLLRI